MADELRKTFPQATDEEIKGGKVSESRRVKGFTIVAWSGHIPRGEYPDWSQFVSGGGVDEYRW